MDSDKRAFVRIPVPMDIEVRIDDSNGVMVLETADISNGSAFIKATPEQCPAVGTEISLRVKGSRGGQEPPTLRARVARTTTEGMGVEFINS